MAQHVPLIGQPTTLIGYAILVTLTCNCEQRGVITLLVQQRAEGMQRTQETCPACKRAFTVQNFGVDAQGQVQFNVEMAAPPPELALSH